MKEENIMKFKLDPNKPIKGKTDWEMLNSVTEEEIHAKALADLDNPPLTKDELEQFKRRSHTKNS